MSKIMMEADNWSNSEPEEETLVDVIVDNTVDVGGPEDERRPKKVVSQLLDLGQIDFENEEIWRISVPIHVRCLPPKKMTFRGYPSTSINPCLQLYSKCLISERVWISDTITVQFPNSSVIRHIFSKFN